MIFLSMKSSLNLVFNTIKSVNVSVNQGFGFDVSLDVKREDLIHSIVSGNKYRKLKYNVLFAMEEGYDTLLTFGGAFSNHIAAVAAVGNAYGLKTIGIIRGQELVDKVDENPTLSQAKEKGMAFKFISRSDYRCKTDLSFLKALKTEFGEFYRIPEGGTNNLAVKGCEEILTEEDKEFDYVCAPVGTGGTLSGLINSSKPNQKILGFSALKGSFLNEDISKFAKQENWKLINDYHFGGYAKINEELVTFVNTFNAVNEIPLDPIYTGKMLFGIMDMIKQGYFPKHSKILAIHTGGLQGIEGMNKILKQKRIPLIQYS